MLLMIPGYHKSILIGMQIQGFMQLKAHMNVKDSYDMSLEDCFTSSVL